MKIIYNNPNYHGVHLLLAEQNPTKRTVFFDGLPPMHLYFPYTYFWQQPKFWIALGNYTSQNFCVFFSPTPLENQDSIVYRLPLLNISKTTGLFV